MNIKRHYRCPICGKRVVLGEHFCVERGGAGREATSGGENIEIKSEARRNGAKTLATAVVASALLMALLWQSIGIYSLAALLLGPIVYISNLIGARPRRRKDSAEYLELLLLVGRDRDTAERLIRAERKRGGAKSREECVRAAKERLERDLSR